MAVTVRRAPGLVTGFCDPYGAETGGPRRVLGGLYGPKSAESPGLDLPAAAEQGEWPCRNLAQVRAYPQCRCGHRGAVMKLCSWHEETVMRGNPAGHGPPVAEVIMTHGHFEEIQRRQLASCPRCLFPGRFAALQREWDTLAAERARYRPGSEQAMTITRKIEAIGQSFDEGRATGVIHNCAMRLVTVS